jgi:hypothetical protein
MVGIPFDGNVMPAGLGASLGGCATACEGIQNGTGGRADYADKLRYQVDGFLGLVFSFLASDASALEDVGGPFVVVFGVAGGHLDYAFVSRSESRAKAHVGFIPDNEVLVPQAGGFNGRDQAWKHAPIAKEQERT